MSLQCEGKGALCSVCGHFDFLPLNCNRCQGVFCSEHIDFHNVAATNKPCVIEDVKVKSVDEVRGTSDKLRCTCVVCGSKMCVLTPCQICRQNFCVEHRFHGHESNEKMKLQDHKSKKSFLQSNNNVTDEFEVLCAQYQPNHPLRLAPSTYRGTMIPVTVLVCKEELEPNEYQDHYSLAVVSLEATGEMSIGQLVERWKASHPLFMSNALTKGLYHIEGTKQIVLRPIPLSLTVKEASLTNHIIVFPLKAMRATEEGTANSDVSCNNSSDFLLDLEMTLTKRLFSSPRELKKNSRLHAVAIRIRLRSTQSREGKPHVMSPPVSSSFGCIVTSQCMEANTDPIDKMKDQDIRQQQVQQLEEEGKGEKEKTSLVLDSWPFRRPPPLEDFIFSHTRSKPRGIDSKFGGAAVSVVAVFVADRLLTSTVAPFCIALSQEWSVGRVVDKIVCVVDDSAASSRKVNWKLFDMKNQGNVLTDDLARKNDLRDGDILFIGEEYPDALRMEVERLNHLKGKQRVMLMGKVSKTCTIM
ncbi:hypothetical protein LSM04_001838 [Trypanosoma melophagium]|uniref:uncharacterized protein n=1 Tax=Trypanosoma melophagium TaxID=715481 RepID=UPI00351A5E16|nr:hypothetical protein LSM04_001838 [Trypanosoma melophagium]